MPDIEVLKLLGKEGTAALAVIIVVVLFLGVIMLIIRAHRADSVAAQMRLMAAAKECHDSQEAATKAMHDHAKAIATHTEAARGQSVAMLQMTIALTKCPGMLPPPEG